VFTRCLLLTALAATLAGCNHPEPVVPPRDIISPGGSQTTIATFRLVSIDERPMPTAHIAGQSPMDSVVLRLFNDGFYAVSQYVSRSESRLVGNFGEVGADSLTFSASVFGGMGGRIRGDSLIVVGSVQLQQARYAYVRR